MSRRSVWVAFLGLVLGELIIGCQETDLNPRGAVNPRASGHAARAIVPPLTITDPPKTSSSMAQRDASRPPLGDSARVDLAKGSTAGATEEYAHDEDDLHRLHDSVMERAAQLESYIVRFRRREVVDGKEQPEEVMSLLFRQHPWSAHMKWLAPEEALGREALYVKDRYDNKLHVLIEKKRALVGGTTMTFDLNDPMVRGRCRHPVTEVGFHEFVNRFHKVIATTDRGDKSLGTLVYHGESKRREFDKPLLLVEHVMPPGYEPGMPQGGHRFLYFDQAEKLPMLVITQDDRGLEVEYYCYDLLQPNVRLDEADFNPAKLGGGKK